MSDLESRVAGSPAQALRLAPGTGQDGAADPPAVTVEMEFRLPGLPPLEWRATVVPDAVAAGLPGLWLPSPTVVGWKFQPKLINLTTGDAVSPV